MKRRISLCVAAGLGLVAFLPARAGDVTISNDRTTPVETTNADGSGPGDITINGSGSVRVGSGPAVTLNSSNSVVNQGTIQVTGDTGNVALLFEAGNTGSLTNSGTISALVTDTDDVATGSGNIAFFVSGNGDFIGNLTFASGSVVQTGGANSAAILLDSAIVGTIDIAGSVTADGDFATAFRSNALITGDLTIESTATFSASGTEAQALLIAGGLDGVFTNNGSISVNGAQANVEYSSTYPRADFAVGIGSSLTGGLKNAGTITATSSSDGVFISPTLGTSIANVALGVIDASSLPYGFANSGTITASTSRSEWVSGVRIQGWSDAVTDYGVTIDGGIQNTGTISATATFDTTAIGLEVGAHASTPTLVNSGTISGSVTSTNTATAYGLRLDQAAVMPAMTNSGTISGTAYALDAYAYGIVDRSGTLLSITNTGDIWASSTTTDEGITSAIAIDLSHAQGGIALNNGGRITGAVLLGGFDDSISLVADSDSDSDTRSTFTGSIAFGDGSDTFSISGDGIFTGGITKGAGTLAITVDDGEVALGSSDTVAATTIDFGAASKLSLVLDPTLAVAPRLDATQSITFANGATIEASVTEFVGTSFTAIVARAPSITASLAPGDLIFDNLPYMYSAATEIDTGVEQELLIKLQLKSASELGLNANQTALYAAVLDILQNDDNSLETPLLALSDGAAFAKAYASLMPKTSQPTLRAALITSDDLVRDLQDRERVFLTGDDKFGGSNFWWRGSGHILSLDASASGPGISGDLVSTTIGGDHILMPWLMVGAQMTFGGTTMSDASSEDDAVRVDSSHAGAYAAASAGPFYLSGSAGGGETSNSSRRVFKGSSTTTIEGAWDGTFLDANAEAGLSVTLWKAIVRPWVGLSWLHLEDEAHQETGGGTGLDLQYDAVDVQVERARAGLTLGYTVDRNGYRMTPEFRAGWSEVLNDLPSDLRGSFVDGSVPFVLATQPIARNQLNAGFGVMLHGGGLAISFDYDASLADDETSHTGTLEISTQF